MKRADKLSLENCPFRHEPHEDTPGDHKKVQRKPQCMVSETLNSKIIGGKENQNRGNDHRISHGFRSRDTYINTIPDKSCAANEWQQNNPVAVFICDMDQCCIIRHDPQ